MRRPRCNSVVHVMIWGIDERGIVVRLKDLDNRNDYRSRLSYLADVFTILSIRYALSRLRSPSYREGLNLPMVPATLLRGSTAGNPKRATESAISSVSPKSESVRNITSSKPLTAWCVCVLIPQTRRSRKGGSSRKTRAGRVFSVPSD